MDRGLSAFVDALIAVFILHNLGWIDVSLPQPIIYRSGESAIERGATEGVEEPQPEQPNPDGDTGEAPEGETLFLTGEPVEGE
jgi:hypothetical protein